MCNYKKTPEDFGVDSLESRELEVFKDDMFQDMSYYVVGSQNYGVALLAQDNKEYFYENRDVYLVNPQIIFKVTEITLKDIAEIKCLKNSEAEYSNIMEQLMVCKQWQT